MQVQLTTGNTSPQSVTVGGIVYSVAFSPASPGGTATVPTSIGNFLINSGICKPGPGNDPPWQLQSPGIVQRQTCTLAGTAHATDVPTLSITPAGGSLVTIAYTMTAADTLAGVAVTLY
jgi:hypothetical protein